jgi:hypothetical protein
VCARGRLEEVFVEVSLSVAAAYLVPMLAQGVRFLQATPTGPTEQNVITLFDNLAGTVSRVALPICVLAFMVGGIIYATAGGSSRQMETGKAAMVGSAVGFAAVLLASTILHIISNALGSGGGGGTGGITAL